jgi:diketogulonate reductase-like aldo/keto reductase
MRSMPGSTFIDTADVYSRGESEEIVGNRGDRGQGAQGRPARQTMDHLESQLPAANVELAEELLDRIDEIVPPGVTSIRPMAAPLWDLVYVRRWVHSVRS